MLKRKCKFQLVNTVNGQFYIRFMTGNGNVIFHSEHYTRKAAAHRAIAIVRSMAADATVEECTIFDGKVEPVYRKTKK